MNHVQQHNLATSLIDYGGTQLDEHLKINYFLIQSSDFDAAKASIAANHERFTDFDTVKDHFLEIRRLQQASKPAATSHVSAVTGCGGGGCTNGRERKNGSHDARKAGLPTQAEVNKQTHIEARRYSKEEYKKFTPAEKQRHWQLMNLYAKPGTDAVKHTVSAVKSKNDYDSDDNKSLFSSSSDTDKKGGSNCDNPALK